MRQDKQERPLKAIFFDWDRTLAYHGNPDNTLGDRLAMMFRSVHLPYSQTEIEAALQRFERDVAAGKVEPLNNPQTRREISGLYRYLLNVLDHEWDWQLLMRLYGSYALLPTTLYENCRKTIQAVAEQGFLTGIISNHSRSARPVIEDMVGDLIPSRHIILSEEEGVHKPAKTIFLRAAGRLGVSPQQCLLVGDNLQVDAIGAVKNGNYARGVWLDRHETCTEQSLPPRVYCISSLKELLNILS